MIQLVQGLDDRVYGYEKRENTNFVVTSGTPDWAIKFKTGCKSEYVIINIQGKQKEESDMRRKDREITDFDEMMEIVKM